jgi:hypothetical protein
VCPIGINAVEEERNTGIHRLGEVFGQVDLKLKLVAIEILGCVVTFQEIDDGFRDGGDSSVVGHGLTYAMILGTVLSDELSFRAAPAVRSIRVAFPSTVCGDDSARSFTRSQESARPERSTVPQSLPP